MIADLIAVSAMVGGIWLASEGHWLMALWVLLAGHTIPENLLLTKRKVK